MIMPTRWRTSTTPQLQPAIILLLNLMSGKRLRILMMTLTSALNLSHQSTTNQGEIFVRTTT
uniref:Uncharacterized protein n=1 Tax=Mesocestoides corti TaxID=53468 RepID=A0A5K3ET69_MESCO